MKFKSKVIEIDAINWNGSNSQQVIDFSRGYDGFGAEIIRFNTGTDAEGTPWGEVYDFLHDTWVNVYPGQWIIKGTKGEFYPCDAEVFEAKYEPVEGLGLYNPEFTKGNTP